VSGMGRSGSFFMSSDIREAFLQDWWSESTSKTSKVLPQWQTDASLPKGFPDLFVSNQGQDGILASGPSKQEARESSASSKSVHREAEEARVEAQQRLPEAVQPVAENREPVVENSTPGSRSTMEIAQQQAVEQAMVASNQPDARQLSAPVERPFELI
jgi:hypothetical protein